MRATYHITLLREKSLLHALQRHPLEGQLYSAPRLILPEVLRAVHILSQPKVCYLDDPTAINPVMMEDKRDSATCYLLCLKESQ